MKELANLEARLDEALAKLGRGGGDAEAVNALQQKLDEMSSALSAAEENAKTARTALSEAEKELEALREETQEQDALDEEDIEALNRQIETLNRAREDAYEDRRRSKQYNQHVRKINADLRRANADNIGDPDLINKSLELEIEQLREEREQDLAEINGILARLQPLVEGTDNG